MPCGHAQNSISLLEMTLKISQVKTHVLLLKQMIVRRDFVNRSTAVAEVEEAAD